LAKETFTIKVEGQTKDSLNQLIDTYMDERMIQEKGDILSIATFLLERNLSIKNPKMIGAMEELDQLTGRINRLFLHLFEQNKTAMEDMTHHLEEDLKKAFTEIGKLKEEKEAVEALVLQKDHEVESMTNSILKYQDEARKLAEKEEERFKYIRILETNQEAASERIAELLALEERNQELLSKQKEDERLIAELREKIATLTTTASDVEKAHQSALEALQFSHEKALFEREKVLSQEFRDEFLALRNQRDHSYEKLEERLAAMQEKYDTLYAEKQGLEFAQERWLEEKTELEKENRRLEQIVKKL